MGMIVVSEAIRPELQYMTPDCKNVITGLIDIMLIAMKNDSCLILQGETCSGKGMGTIEEFIKKMEEEGAVPRSGSYRD